MTLCFIICYACFTGILEQDEGCLCPFPNQLHHTPKNGTAIEVQNFLGEKFIRELKMAPGVTGCQIRQADP